MNESPLRRSIDTIKQRTAAAPKPPIEAQPMKRTTRPGEAAFIEFMIKPGHWLGYAPHQIMHYQLITHPVDPSNAPAGSSQTLTLGLQTTDLVITGQRLHLITEALIQNALASVRTVPERYGQLDTDQPYIATIALKSLHEVNQSSA